MFKDQVDLNVNVSLTDLVAGSCRLERERAKTIEHKTESEPTPNETALLAGETDQPMQHDRGCD
jgi:hypothetical protein